MLNIIGLTISFIGVIIMVYDVISSKPSKGGITWGEFDEMGTKQWRNKIFTIVGLVFIAIGFIFQLIYSVLTLN
jgi:hypothetical protein